jgi:hypothetical protein
VGEAAFFGRVEPGAFLGQARELLGQRGFNGVASVPKAGVGHEMVDAIQQG